MKQEVVKLPKFVVEWLSGNDWREDTKGKQTIFDILQNLELDSENGYHTEVRRWMDVNADIFARAWLDGYEQEEPLYTVEIPNPNRIGSAAHVLMRNCLKQVVITHIICDGWQKEEEYQLTEEEIKKDFDWAWQWVKPVED